MGWIYTVLDYLVVICNILGILIIVYGMIISSIEFVKKIFSSAKISVIKSNEIIRFRFGSYLILSLEFFIASDVIRSMAVPTWNTLGFLGAIVVIRTILSYFLDREIEKYAEIS